MAQLHLLTDEELVALYCSGEDVAFDILLDRHKDRLYSYILYIVRNADLADDIFQETFVRVIMTLRDGRYKENGKFYSWLTRIAHNLVIDQFRTERTEKTISRDEVEGDILNNIRYAEACVESDIENNQTMDDIRALVEMLPEPQREVVQLRYYQNLSFKEISTLTGVSINTALGRMRYAILNMRKMAEERNLQLNLV